MLRVDGLSLGYDGLPVLRNVSLHVAAGELVTVIGANGAGKTTLLRGISGLVRAAAGRVVLDGIDVGALPVEARVGRGLIHVPEGRMVLTRMTVRDNLLLGAHLRRDAAGVATDLAAAVALFPRLRERQWQLAGTLSGGEQQMLAIARGLMGRPKVLMLDEPSLGIAPILVDAIFEVIREIQARSIAVLLVEQNARMALEHADRGYVLELGEMVAQGDAAGLLEDQRVVDAYLGT